MLYKTVNKMNINYQLTNLDFLEHQLYTSSKSELHKKRRFRSRIIIPILYLVLGFFFANQSGKLGIGIGFAVFGILRYRTEAILIHNLTYLFVVIGLGILNAVVNDKIGLDSLLFINILITVVTVGLERLKWFAYGEEIKITYSGIEMLKQPVNGGSRGG